MSGNKIQGLLSDDETTLVWFWRGVECYKVLILILIKYDEDKWIDNVSSRPIYMETIVIERTQETINLLTETRSTENVDLIFIFQEFLISSK